MNGPLYSLGVVDTCCQSGREDSYKLRSQPVRGHQSVFRFAPTRYIGTMASQSRRVFIEPGLPNLFLSRTYSINKSGAKKVTVGLEFMKETGLFRPVIKLFSTNQAFKAVTIDQNFWELLKDQMEYMISYVQGTFCLRGFATPSLITADGYEIEFTNAYSQKAISINQVSSVAAPAPTVPEPIFPEGQNIFEDETEEIDVPPPPPKKRRLATPMNFVMQLATLDGFRKVLACVDTVFEQLKKDVNCVNKVIDIAVTYFGDKLLDETEVKRSNILKNSLSFGHFYSLNKSNVELYVENNLKSINEFDEKLVDMVLKEFYGFGLNFILKELNKTADKNVTKVESNAKPKMIDISM